MRCCRWLLNLLHIPSTVVFLFSIVCSGLHGQKFHFGGTVAVVASQVDGDNLRGFNKLGYSAGLLSGYSFNSSHWLMVELQYATFGSNQNNEDNATRLETEFKTINVMCGYVLRFGDAWDGTKKFRISVGPRIHAIQKSKLGRDDGHALLDRYILSAHASFGILLSDSFILDLSYNQGLSNILKTELMGIDKLKPYYLSLGVVYYLYK